jgi:gluconate 2-dehydrogenase gamma chain
MIESPAAVLTSERRRTLEALVDRILPGIEGPGAAATGVATAVEGAIVDPFLRRLRPGIEKALDGLDARAEEKHARAFSACTSSEQDELLDELGRDAHPMMRMFLRTAIALSLEGLLGDPVHGGNRDGRGWSAVGLHAADVRSGLCRSWQGD